MLSSRIPGALFADETTAPVLDPGRERTKTGQLWAYARDDHPWGGGDPPMVAYVDADDRKAERAEAYLGDFAGILQVDGYGGYAALAKRRQQVQLAFCWAHVRRKFYELADTSPVATEVLRRIALLYAIEDQVRGEPAQQRRSVRDERSRVIIDDLHQYLEARNRQVSAKARLGEAIRYALNRWDGLSRFLDDGRVDLDNNAANAASGLLRSTARMPCSPGRMKAATRNDLLSLNVQYLHAEYDDLRYQAYSVSGASPVIGCAITPTTLTGASAAALLLASIAGQATGAGPAADIVPAPVPGWIILCTMGGPMQSAGRSQPANALVWADKAWKFDCGDGAVGQLAKAGLQPSAVNVLLLSHLHFDHTGGGVALIGLRYQTSAPGKLASMARPLPKH